MFGLILSDHSNDPSPWSNLFITKTLQATQQGNIVMQEFDILAKFYEQRQNIYGANYKNYSIEWFDQTANNLNLAALNLQYNASNRAIAIQNTALRALPTHDPFFYSKNIAGQGYPFDLSQISYIAIGTPLYICLYNLY
jgi:hypothetical protein